MTGCEFIHKYAFLEEALRNKTVRSVFSLTTLKQCDIIRTVIHH